MRKKVSRGQKARRNSESRDKRRQAQLDDIERRAKQAGQINASRSARLATDSSLTANQPYEINKRITPAERNRAGMLLAAMIGLASFGKKLPRF